MTGWGDPPLLQGVPWGWPVQSGKGLAVGTELSASVPCGWGNHPIVLVGLLPCAKWWRQRPLSPSEDKTKEGVSDFNLMAC